MFEKKINKCADWVFLKEHPLVRFTEYPLSNIPICNGTSIRLKTVDVKASRIDLVDRLKKEMNIRNRIFVVYPFNAETLYSIMYNPMDFSEVKTIRFAEIEVTPEEWNFMMKDQIKKRQEKYKKLLEKERRANTNYKYILIRR
jgi:hypothetical protein